MNERIKKFAIESGAMEFGDSVIPATMDIEKFYDVVFQYAYGLGFDDAMWDSDYEDCDVEDKDE